MKICPKVDHPNRFHSSGDLTIRLFVAAVIIFLLFGVGKNADLAVASLCTLVAGAVLLWRPGESPIMIFYFFYAWVQASIAIFHANIIERDVTDLPQFSSDMRNAILLSFGSLLALAVGLRLGVGRWRWQDGYLLRAYALGRSYREWFVLYLLASMISNIALIFAWVVPGLSQVLIALAALKWGFYFVFAYVVFAGSGGRMWLVAAFLIELASAVGGFFSDFKTVFFVTIFAALASNVRLSPKGLVGVGILGACALLFGVAWTAIKDEYRNYASGGQATQAVTIDDAARIEKLGEMVGALTTADLLTAAEKLAQRISYVEYFGAVLLNVPAVVPHERGAISWDAISRPFMPRLLFPDKAVIDDSSRTAYYTGLEFAGSEQATSFSLGWVAEMYIDFGVYGLFPACLLIGLCYGSVYRVLVRWRSSPVLGPAFATGAFNGVLTLEASFTKTFGMVMTSLVVCWVLLNLVLPRLSPGLILKA